WNVSEVNRPRLVREFRLKGKVARVAFGGRSELLAASTGEGQVVVWSLEDGGPLRFPDAVRPLGFNSDLSVILASSARGGLEVWTTAPLRQGKQLMALTGETRCETVFSSDGRRVAVRFKGHPTFIWDLKTHQRVPLFDE